MSPNTALAEALAIVRDNDTTAEAKAAPLPTRRLSDLLADPAMLAPAEWVLQPFFERGTLSNMYGPGKVGKSTMLADIAAHVARGEHWAGQRTAQGRVLWVDLEQGPRRLARTFRELDDEAASQIDVWSELGDPPKLSAIRETIAKLEPALVIIDSLGKFCQVDDENDNAVWQLALRPLEDLARSQRAAVVVIDHDRKGEGTHGRAMRGASSKLAAFDAAIQVQRGATPTSRKLDMVSREIGDFTFVVDRTAEGYRASTGKEKVNQVLLALQSQKEAVSVKVLHFHMKSLGYGMSEETVRNQLEKLVADGSVVQSGEGKKNSPTLFEAVGEAE